MTYAGRCNKLWESLLYAPKKGAVLCSNPYQLKWLHCKVAINRFCCSHGFYLYLEINNDKLVHRSSNIFSLKILTICAYGSCFSVSEYILWYSKQDNYVARCWSLHHCNLIVQNTPACIIIIINGHHIATQPLMETNEKSCMLITQDQTKMMTYT